MLWLRQWHVQCKRCCRWHQGVASWGLVPRCRHRYPYDTYSCSLSPKMFTQLNCSPRYFTISLTLFVVISSWLVAFFHEKPGIIAFLFFLSCFPFWYSISPVMQVGQGLFPSFWAWGSLVLILTLYKNKKAGWGKYKLFLRIYNKIINRNEQN